MRRLNAGFRAESFGPFAYLFEKIAREKYEFDLKPVPKFGGGEAAEISVLGGELDFLLGNHYTPIAAKARGVHICWLAIPMSEHNYKVVTRPDIEEVNDLVGKTVLLPAGRCPALNMMLVLRQLGLEGKVQCKTVKGEQTHRYYKNSLLTKLKEGEGDAVVVDSPLDLMARRMELKVFPAPKLDVIAGPCITTTPGFANKEPDMTMDLLKAYLESIHAFKTDKKRVVEILLEESSLVERDDTELIDAWYAHTAGRMSARAFPTPTALEWTQAKAALEYPEAKDVNALRVVALDYLLELDRDGFIDDLWAQK